MLGRIPAGVPKAAKTLGSNSVLPDSHAYGFEIDATLVQLTSGATGAGVEKNNSSSRLCTTSDETTHWSPCFDSCRLSVSAGRALPTERAIIR
jgi:hypothetical protein